MNVGENRIDFGNLLLPYRRGCIDHMQNEIRMHRFIQSRLEGLNQLMRQTADKTDSVGRHHSFLIGEPELSRRCIQRGEKLIGCVRFCTRDLIEKRRLAGIRIARERYGDRIAARTGTALRAPLPSQALELISQLLHARADHAPVKLNLLFTRTARLP